MKPIARACLDLLLLTLVSFGCAPNEQDSGAPEPSSPSDGTPAATSPEGAQSTPGGELTPEPAGPPAGPSAAGETTGGVPNEAPPTEAPLDPGAPPSEHGGSEAPSADPPSCASAPELGPGNHSLTLEHDGVERTYLVHVPVGIEPTRAVPLVVDLHGLTSSATAQAGISGWRAKADAEGFIVAHPQGLGNSWNGGDLCCGSSQQNDVDDEGFIRALVAQMQKDACIDPQRVYATGLSNGGAMSHLLACNAADLFAASAPVSMGNGTRPCQPSRPISVVMTRGTRDTLVAFNGGLFPSAQEDFEQWAALDGCEGEPVPAHDLCQRYERCAGGVTVELCALDAGHVLYDNNQDFSVPDVVWETFEAHTLP